MANASKTFLWVSGIAALAIAGGMLISKKAGRSSPEESGLEITAKRTNTLETSRPSAPPVQTEEGASVTRTNIQTISVAGLEADGTETVAENEDDRVVRLVSEGNELLSAGRNAEAVRKFEEAIALSADQEDLHYNLGIALSRVGRVEEAKKAYRDALAIYPEYGEAHNNLGNLLLKENKIAEAIASFQEAIKTMPENAAFHNNLGTAYARQGRMAEAASEFELAVQHDPAHVEARVNVANAYISRGQISEAVEQLNEALRLRPGFPPAEQALLRARGRQNNR